MHYYSHNIGDYRSDTAHLSLLEHGCYRQLLDWYYKDEKPIPEKTEVVFRRLSAKTEEDKLAIVSVLNDFFQLGPDGYRHGRCDIEIESYSAKADLARLNGKLGGRPKKTEVVISGNPEETESKANHKPITINQEPLTNNQKVKSIVPPNGETQDVFDYWKTFHNHPQAKLDDKRSKAIKARLKDGYSVGDICQAIEGCKYSEYHQGKNDSGTVYDDIELICRNATNVDKFIILAKRGPPNGVSQQMNQTLSDLQQWVLEGENG